MSTGKDGTDETGEPEFMTGTGTAAPPQSPPGGTGQAPRPPAPEGTGADEPVPERTPTRRVSTFATLRRLGPYLHPFRWHLLAGIGAALGASLTALGIPLLVQRIVDGPVLHQDLDALPPLLAAVVVLALLEPLLFWVRRRVIAGPATTVEKRMRADLYRHLQRLPIGFHDQWQSGQLLSRAVGDLTSIRRFVAFGLPFLLVNSLTVLVGLGVLFHLSPGLALVLLATAIPMVVLTAVFELKYRDAARKAQDQDGELATTVEESVLGIRVLKAFGRGPQLVDRFARQARTLRTLELRKVRILALVWALIIVLPELAIAAQLGVGGYAVTTGGMTVGTVVAAVTTTTYLRWPIDSIGWLLAEANLAAAACERYHEVMDTPVTVTDPPRPASLPEPVRGELRLEGVRFRYPGSPTELLAGVDLVVRPGETLALVGPTGCGKTTLTSLVARLRDVTGGRITLDGVDIRDLPLAHLRRAVATAFEEPVLFSASVRENVALGRPDASDDEVWEALRVAHADRFVADLPWGLDTRIGEQGLSLSGGQRQRLALARALLADFPVLVLDEPAEHLDLATADALTADLLAATEGRTTLLITHRLAGLEAVDEVIVLDRGRVVQQGTYAELAALPGPLRRMIEREAETQLLVEAG